MICDFCYEDKGVVYLIGKMPHLDKELYVCKECLCEGEKESKIHEKMEEYKKLFPKDFKE